MHVDERLRRARRLEQRVAPRRHLAEPASDREHEVGVAKPCGELLVHRHSEHARRSSASGCRRSPGSETRTPRAARSPRRTRGRHGSSPLSTRPRRRRRAGARRRRAAPAAARRPPPAARSAPARRQGHPRHPPPRRERPPAARARPAPACPESATENASAMCSGIRSALSTSHAAFAIPPKTCA